MADVRKVAYFSMEIALEPGLPSYSGGLGILAGDTIRAAADLRVPLVAITLIYKKGYFYQKLGQDGWQTEEDAEWVVDDFLRDTGTVISLTIENRPVNIKIWQYKVTGISDFTIPVYFLDSDLPENAEWDRVLTHHLYGGDRYYRLCQEVILGVGGVRALRALGYTGIERFHMNEGHASLLTLELIGEYAEQIGKDTLNQEDLDIIRKKCVFTTHTPVPAGHDKFPMDLVKRVLGDHIAFCLEEQICFNKELNMTYLALYLSDYVNGVAKKHKEVSNLMFSPYTIDSITNGVHALTWLSEPFKSLFDRYIPGWREDSFNIRYALSIPNEEIWKAHMQNKWELVNYINRKINSGMDKDVLTLGFARRSANYKRADLIFHDIERFRKIAIETGKIQVVYAGKAHPNDEGGKELIKRIFQAKERLKPDVKIAYLANYDMELAKLITSGVDIWLNTPQPPMEASGTSGMKAALNGVPSFSILDGWWIEGCLEDLTGWAIGENLTRLENKDYRMEDAASLYDKLEKIIVPTFYNNRNKFVNIMCHAIAINGSFFNTQRMIQQYVLRAYFR